MTPGDRFGLSTLPSLGSITVVFDRRFPKADMQPLLDLDSLQGISEVVTRDGLLFDESSGLFLSQEWLRSLLEFLDARLNIVL